ncbi:trans-aconitate 2-methyltransferase [Pseudogemmobacter bohemicus]|uniref:trans-aconitate 2-methyltransferase n=1 Tax=Pseudogemmobacter bohemicus TaxID=2250708 RepID=UPI000DD43978|nr:trans-aconitate 2-methyltransferase [Pseudogemmobacter bohemicus]
MGWSAGQYAKFLDARTRPARDLLAAVPLEEAREVSDLGSGPGNSTALLRERFGTARITGIDTDADMLRMAREALPDCRFEEADIAIWQAGRPQDLIFANASLQWIPDHRSLFPRLLAQLAPGGVLAVQMPDNLQEPTHIAMHGIAAGPRWAARLERARARRLPLLDAGALQALLRPGCSRLDIWRTVYHFELQGLDAVIEWFLGSALRQLLAPLSEAERGDFLAAFRARIAPFYPEQGGRILLPFPRAFFVATRAG